MYLCYKVNHPLAIITMLLVTKGKKKNIHYVNSQRNCTFSAYVSEATLQSRQTLNSYIHHWLSDQQPNTKKKKRHYAIYKRILTIIVKENFPRYIGQPYLFKKRKLGKESLFSSYSLVMCISFTSYCGHNKTFVHSHEIRRYAFFH